MRETRFNRKYLLVYSAVFALLALAVFLPFVTAGKSMVGNGDGQSQYILQLRYMGEWLRETAQNILHGNFALRTYDFTIGMGDDINAIVRFHPLDYLSVFVPAAHTEGLYTFLILLRMYLAGISFSLYAFYWRKSGLQVLAGSITWLFCGYVFELGIVHPIYLAPMIVLPLLLLGAEYMMEKRRTHSFALFALMVYLGFTSNYYFMYINSVALLAYVLIRFFVLYGKGERAGNFFSLLIRMVSAYLTGLALSCVTLLPTLYRYFHSYRSASLSKSGNLLYYEDFRRYFAWMINLISPLEASGNGTHLNFAVTVLPAIVILVLAGRGKWKSMKRILLVLLVFLLLPLGGYIMAVMHTENNRWVYLISLAAAMCVTFASDHFFALNLWQKRGLAVTVILFDAAVFALSVLYPVSVYHILAAVELTAFAGCIFLQERMHGTFVLKARGTGFVLAVTAVSAAVGGYFTFGGRFGNLTRYYADRGTTQTFFTDSEYANYAKAHPETGTDVWHREFCRVDGIWDDSREDNASLLLGYPGVQIYNSVLNASQIRYLLDTQNCGLTTMLHIRSLDARTGAEALAGVKYFQTLEKKSAQLPYGFTRQVFSDGKMGIWENEYPLSFGFATDQVAGRSQLAGLSGAQIDELMLDCAVVEDEEAAQLTDGHGLSPARVQEAGSGILTVKVDLPAGKKGIKRTETGYQVTKRKAALRIPYQRKAGYDVLVSFTGLKPDGFGATMSVKGKGISKRVTLLSEEQTYTLGREDYLVALGYADSDAEDVLRIRFSKKGTYNLESVSLVYIPREGYAEKIRALNAACLRNASFAPDTVTGQAVLDHPAFMVFQIPWSEGWSAQVNGERAVLYQADECYLGLALDAGDSDIRLVYHTPWGREGILLSVAGIVLFVIGFMNFRRKKRRQ